MTDPVVATPLPLAPRAEQMFPTLTGAQLERIAARGRIRVMQQGDILFAAGDQNFSFFAVRSGRIEIVQTTKEPETIVAVHGPGQFTGYSLIRLFAYSLFAVRCSLFADSLFAYSLNRWSPIRRSLPADRGSTSLGYFRIGLAICQVLPHWSSTMQRRSP